jgi:tetratricopeptide (TPR) repeat protein
MKLRILTTTAVLLTTTSLTVTLDTLAPLQAKAENLEHTQQLLSTKQCSQCELSGAGLVLSDLAGADLSGADLSRANLSRANLMGADLSGANLTGASLNGANLSGANLSGATLHGTDLRDAILLNALLYGTSLKTAYIQGTVGIPEYAGTAEDFYAWGVIESDRGNYRGAIANYNQALSLKSDFAPAYLARSVSRFNLNDFRGATQDAQVASTLFSVQQNLRGYQLAQSVIKGLEIAQNPPKARARGPSIGDFFVSIGSVLLQLLPLF